MALKKFGSATFIHICNRGPKMANATARYSTKTFIVPVLTNNTFINSPLYKKYKIPKSHNVTKSLVLDSFLIIRFKSIINQNNECSISTSPEFQQGKMRGHVVLLNTKD